MQPSPARETSAAPLTTSTVASGTSRPPWDPPGRVICPRDLHALLELVSEQSVRVRIGDKELEVHWSGKLDQTTASRLERLQQHFEASIGLTPPPDPARGPPSALPPGRGMRTQSAKGGVHGGSRKASISKGVDELLTSGWLVKKTQDEIVEKLHERFLGANSDNVLHVLKRRLNKTLVRVRTDRGEVWSPIEK